MYNYPFPKTPPIYTYQLPLLFGGRIKREIVKWDYEINPPRRKNICLPAVYIWHENQHAVNKPIYVGSTEYLYNRISAHCHRSKASKPVCGESPVMSYMRERMDHKFIPCENYPAGCDCIPRYNVRALILENIDLFEYEKLLIETLRPILNKRIYRINKFFLLSKKHDLSREVVRSSYPPRKYPPYTDRF